MVAAEAKNRLAFDGDSVNNVVATSVTQGTPQPLLRSGWGHPLSTTRYVTYMNQGQAVIDAVICSGAIENMIVEGDSKIFVWRANAIEQIEAALAEAGLKIVVAPKWVPREGGGFECHKWDGRVQIWTPEDGYNFGTGPYPDPHAQ